VSLPSWSPGTPEAPPPGPTLVHKIEPVYPKQARGIGQYGTVVVRVLVDSTGHVQQAEVDRRREGHMAKPLLEAAAIAAARQSTFEPAMTSGKSTASWILIAYRFAPTITIDLTASDTAFTVGDSITVTAKITSDSRADSLRVGMTFPINSYGIHARIPEISGVELMPTADQGFAAAVVRRSWTIDLLSERPTTLTAKFAATSCGSAEIRVRCTTTDGAVVVDQVLPVCIRGHVGSHFAEYRQLAAGDTTKRGLRVDDRVFAQRADSCCYDPTLRSR